MNLLISAFVVLAQGGGRGEQKPPDDEGIGIGLVLLGFLIALAIFATVFLLLRRTQRRERTGPPREPHRPDSVGH